MDLIQESVDEVPGHLKHHLQVMAGLDNVPRKEKQFRNFTTNSLNLKGQRNADSIVTEIWDFLKDLKAKQLAARAEEETKAKEAAEEAKKEKETENTKESVETDPKVLKGKSVDAKSVKKAMKKVLKKSKDKSLSLKHLRKAVQQHLGAPDSTSSEIKDLVKMNVKSTKKQTFVLDGKVVSLKSSN